MRSIAPQPRPPIGLVLVVLALALLVLAGALAWLAWQFTLLDPTIAAVLRIAILALPVAAGAVLIVALYNRLARVEIVKADRTIALTRATVQRFPDALTSLSFHDSSKPAIAPVPEPEPLLLAAPEKSVPSFGQLLEQGKIGPGKPLLLGYDAATGQAIEGSWNSLYSTGIGGMTGSGKSWLEAFLISQSAAAGARLIVIDPHAGDRESLSERIAGLSAAYMCNVASDGKAIESALKLAADKLTGRIAGRGGLWPLLFIADEWTSLLRGKLGDLLTATALEYAEQGRKFGCFAMLAAQAWQVDAAGPVRDRLASHYAMRTRGDQFRYQMGLRGSAPLDTLFLKPGEAYFLSVKGDLVKVQIPMMTPADLARVGGMLDTPAAVTGQPFGFHRAGVVASALASTHTAPEANWKPDGSLVEAKTDQASTATQRTGSLPPEAARAAALFLAGNDLPAIVKELRGVEAGRGGRNYQTAAKEISDLLRQAMKGA